MTLAPRPRKMKILQATLKMSPTVHPVTRMQRATMTMTMTMMMMMMRR